MAGWDRLRQFATSKSRHSLLRNRIVIGGGFEAGIGGCFPSEWVADLVRNMHPSHDLAELLDWDDLQAIDAGLMFKQLRFAELDNRNIATALNKPINRLFDLATKTPWWITQTLYEVFPLRDDVTRHV